MESVKLPVLKLGSLPASARYRHGAGDDHSGLGDNVLPSLTSPSRAALLLVNSAPSASTTSLVSARRSQFSARRPLRERREQPEDFAKTPLERATEQLQTTRERTKATLARLADTQTQFAHDESQLTFVTQQLQVQQRALAVLFARFFDAQARQIQRAFRGHRGRRVFRQMLAVRAVLKIQRAYRAAQSRKQSRRKKLRLLCRKVLRGLRGVSERHDLAHHELLNRVNHNMLIETQWRRAMGIDDAESDLMTALYRKRYMRRRLGEILRRANTIRSIVTYWQRLVPRLNPPAEHVDDDQSESEFQATNHAGNEAEYDNNYGDDGDDGHFDSEEDPSNVIVIRMAGGPMKQSSSRSAEVPGRPELLRRQRVFTRRVQEENQRREAAHSKALDQQKEQAQLMEQEAREMEEQRRRERARALQHEVERRGLIAIKELQAKKEREERERQATEHRAALAKRTIAAQVLSPETQQRLRRQQQRQHRKQQQQEHFNN